LQLEEAEPPAVLYHGTGEGTTPAIEREGLRKMSRHHVHLSADVPTARKVGARHGRPVVFAVDAAALHAAGVTFFRSANGVWLVGGVPPEYLRRLTEACPPPPAAPSSLPCPPPPRRKARHDPSPPTLPGARLQRRARRRRPTGAEGAAHLHPHPGGP